MRHVHALPPFYSQVTLDLPRLPASAEQLRAAGGVFRQYHDMYTVITPR